jgi:hypothetical protein
VALTTWSFIPKALGSNVDLLRCILSRVVLVYLSICKPTAVQKPLKHTTKISEIITALSVKEHFRSRSIRQLPASESPSSHDFHITHSNKNAIYDYIMLACRSQWPRGLKRELSLPAQTLKPCVRIPLEVWMSV